MHNHRHKQFGSFKNFTSFVAGLDNALNDFESPTPNMEEADFGVRATPFQAQIHSIHHYPYVVVVEKRERPMDHLLSVRRGTEWQSIRL